MQILHCNLKKKQKKHEAHERISGSWWCIWHHRTLSTSMQVMACCLMAPSHYLYQYHQRSCGIHQRSMSQEKSRNELIIHQFQRQCIKELSNHEWPSVPWVYSPPVCTSSLPDDTVSVACRPQRCLPGSCYVPHPRSPRGPSPASVSLRVPRTPVHAAPYTAWGHPSTGKIGGMI